MRAIILILILLIVAAIAAIATGFLDIDQTQPAEVPRVTTTENGIQAQGGQPPAFDVETGKIEVGTREATVPVPDIRVNPADGRQQPAQGAQPGTQPGPQPAPPPASSVPTTNATQQ